jgi:hypothetical protein
MRKLILRSCVATLAVLGLVIATASIGSARPSASLSDCPNGHVGLMVQWANAHVSLMCGTAVGQQDTTPPEIVGLVVRWADGSVGTIDLQADQPAATESAVAETSVSEAWDDAAGSGSSWSSGTSSSYSSSQSSSTSTSCINGQCTTTTTVCADGQCSSSQP